MELKSHRIVPIDFERLSSNRTFMELKLRKVADVIGCDIVLIVPLWN